MTKQEEEIKITDLNDELSKNAFVAIQSYKDVCEAQDTALRAKQEEITAVLSMAESMEVNGYSKEAANFIKSSLIEIDEKYSKIEDEIDEIASEIESTSRKELKNATKELRKCMKFNDPNIRKTAINAIINKNESLKVAQGDLTRVEFINSITKSLETDRLSFQKLMEDFDKARTFIKDKAITPLVTAIKAPGIEVKEATLKSTKWAVEKSKHLAEQAKLTAQKVKGLTKEWIESAWDIAKEFTNDRKEDVKDKAEDIKDHIKEAADKVKLKIKEKLARVGQKLVDAYENSDLRKELGIKVNGAVEIDGTIEQKNENQYIVTGTVVLPSSVISMDDRSGIAEQLEKDKESQKDR